MSYNRIKCIETYFCVFCCCLYVLCILIKKNHVALMYHSNLVRFSYCVLYILIFQLLLLRLEYQIMKGLFILDICTRLKCVVYRVRENKNNENRWKSIEKINFLYMTNNKILFSRWVLSGIWFFSRKNGRYKIFCSYWPY